MSGKVRKRPFADEVHKFLTEFEDLKYDGAKIICIVCDMPLMCWDKSDCKKHVNSGRHKEKKGEHPRNTFMFDFVYMLITCNLPLKLLANDTFRDYCKKYVTTIRLPSESTARRFLPLAREKLESAISAELYDKKVWLCVAETTDYKKNSIVNVVVRTLDPLKPSCSLLLANKRLPKCTANAIKTVVLNALAHFNIENHQVLLFVTDSTSTMHAVASSLKNECGYLLHTTCKLHALHLVVEEIQNLYPRVNTLIVSTEAVFLKSPQRIRDFHRQCPDIPKPPQHIFTRWGTWLRAAFYYFQHFGKVKSVVLKFNPQEAPSIRKCQASFQDPYVEGDLHIIHDRYKGLVNAIEQLQNPFLSLVESLQIVESVHTQLQSIKYTTDNSVLVTLDTVLQNDFDFATIKQISVSEPTDPLYLYKEMFTYANVTSLDVERSFSAYKKIFSPKRTSFAETALETYLMLQMAHHANLDVNFD